MRLAIVLSLIALAPSAFAQIANKAIRVSEVISAPIDEVWRAWSTSDGWRSTLNLESRIELEPGGAFEIYFAPDAPQGEKGSEGCTVLSYLPRRMLTFTWNAPPSLPAVRAGDHHTVVVVQLDPVGRSRTRVTLTHHHWPEAGSATFSAAAEEWDKTYEYFERAWPAVVGAMKAHYAKEGPPHDAYSGWVYLFTGFSRPDLLETLTSEEQSTLIRHAAYIRDLTKTGDVVFAGPCTDQDAESPGPGIVIVEAATEDEARGIMENDPAVKAGLFIAELHPIRFSMLRERDAH